VIEEGKVDNLLAQWSWKEISVFLTLCGAAGMISTICSAYSFPREKADSPDALNSRIRGTISLIVTLALWGAAAGAYLKYEQPKQALNGYVSPSRP